MNVRTLFARPADEQLAHDWDHVMQCGQAFIEAIERYAPASKNRAEASDRAYKAIVVVNGAFHLRQQP